MDPSPVMTTSPQTLGVIPVLIGPMQALLAILPAILLALGSLIVTMFKPKTIWRLLQLLWSQKFVVLPIVAVIVGGIWAYNKFMPEAGGHTGEMVVAATDWPAYRGTPSRTGYVPGKEGDQDPAHGTVNWTYTDGGIKAFYSSPAVVGNRVFVTSARWELFNKDGGIYCLDADSGEVVWKYTSGYRATFSSPAVAKFKGQDGTERMYLVVGEGLHLTDDARVFCLDVDASNKSRKGVKLWEYPTKSHVESSPCIADGKAFIGAGDDGMYCFNLEPKKDEQGENVADLVWHLEGGKAKEGDPIDPNSKEFLDCETSPVAHAGKLYFGLGIGGHAVVCVDIVTGKEDWRCPTPYPVFGSPSVSGNYLFVGMGNGDMVNTAAKLRLKPAGEVWCLDLNDKGKVKWKCTVGQVVLGTIAVEGNRAYFGSRDGNLYCVDVENKGEILQQWDARASIVTSPSVGKDYVYVVTESGELYALDKQRLTPVWAFSLGSASMSSPAVANGHVYVGTNTDGFKCIGRPGLEKKKPLHVGAMGGAGKSGWTDGSPSPEGSEMAWNYDQALPGVTAVDSPPLGQSAAAYLNGAMYVGLSQGQVKGLARLDFPLGEKESPKLPLPPKLFEKPALKWFVPTANAVTLPAAVAEKAPPPAEPPTDEAGRKELETPQDKLPDAVYFVDGKQGDQNRSLWCADPKTGQVRWQRPVAAEAGGEFIITYDRLIIADRADGLTVLDIGDAGGAREVWKFTGGQCVGVPLLTDGILIVALRAPGKLVAMDALDGTELWKTALPQSPTTGPVRVEDTIWVGQDDGLLAVSLYDGKQKAAIACGPVAGRLLADGEHLVASAADGKLTVIDFVKNKDTGLTVPTKREATIDDAAPGTMGLLTYDSLVYLSKDALRRYDFAKGKSTRVVFLYTQIYGPVTSPMIMVKSGLFMATEKKGLLCMKKK